MLAPPSLTALVRRLARVAPWIGFMGALAWAANIYFLSSRSSLSGATGPYIAWLSNLAHAPVYGILAIFVFLALPRVVAHAPARDTAHAPARDPSPTRAPTMDSAAARFSARRAVLVVVIAVLYGISDEMHQSFTPGRDASVFDILTDLSGAFLASAALVTFAAPAASRNSARVLVCGLSACVLSAWLATEIPHRFPELLWL